MLLHHTGLTKVEVASRLVCFGADGALVFQGSRNGVTVQMQQYMAPFLFGVHCMAHCTNLAVEPLSNLPIVAKLESLCQAMYSYFCHSPKHHLEFQKLADLVETKGRSMLKNVKTRWLSLLEPLKRVMGEYKTLIAKMCQDAAVKEPELTVKQTTARESARQNYELLCDIEAAFRDVPRHSQRPVLLHLTGVDHRSQHGGENFGIPYCRSYLPCSFHLWSQW